jgi:hypothetical protein
MLGTVGPMEPALRTFRHEAFLYAGSTAFLEGTVPFVQAGLRAGEPVLVMAAAWKIDPLRKALGRDAERVSFADMGRVGRNPARLIPAWRDFLATHGCARPARGICEAAFAERTPEELVECGRDEALLNVAFAQGTAWRLLCPYDTSALGADAIESARHSHRFVTDGRCPQESRSYRGDTSSGPTGDELPQPPGEPRRVDFGGSPLDDLREVVTSHLTGVIDNTRLSDLLIAVSEVASNSLLHGGGEGTLRVWSTGRSVACEVRDRGWIRQPIVGRTRPKLDQESGRGLWMVNQLCDLVQIRSSPAGTVVRMHMYRR